MLTIGTVKAVTSVAAGKAAVGGGISATAITLAEEVMKSMMVVKATIIVAVLAFTVGGASLAGTGWLQPSGAVTPLPGRATAVAHPFQIKPAEMPEPKIDPRVDLFGDALPDGAMARLGTVRFRQGMVTRALAFAPDGKTLASAGSDGSGSLCIWNPADGKAIYRLEVPSLVLYLAYSPNSKMLVTTGYDQIFLLDAATGKQLRRLETPAGGEWGSVAFSPIGNAVAIAQRVGPQFAIFLWDPATGKEIRRLTGHTEEVISIDFSPDGKTIASASRDKTIRVWDVANGKVLTNLEGQPAQENRVAFSPDGKGLASMGAEGVILVWDVATAKQERKLQAGDRMLSNFVFSPDGRQLAASEIGGLIRLWDPSTGQELRNWKATTFYNSALAFSPDGKILATAGSLDHAIRLWDPETGRAINPPGGHTGMINSVRFTTDGRTLLSGSQDRRILEWDVASGRQRREFFAEPPDSADALARVWLYDLSPDAKTIAWSPRFRNDVKKDPIIRVWDTTHQKMLHTWSWVGEAVWTISFAPNGKLLASGDKQGITIWEVATGTALHCVKQKNERASSMAFSPDSRLLAYGEDVSDIVICDVATGKELRRWVQNDALVYRVVFSPDGKSLATAGGGTNGISVWAVDSGKLLQKFGGRGGVYSLVYSPDGRVVSAMFGGVKTLENGDSVGIFTLHLWETLTSQEIRQIDVPQGNVWAMAFTADGRTLATGGADSTILLWDLTGHAENGKLKAGDLTAKDLNRLWSDLAGDAPQANRAMWSLALAPKQSLPFLKERLRQPAAAKADQLAKLVADLDSDRFDVRQKATRELDQLAEGAEAALRKR